MKETKLIRPATLKDCGVAGSSCASTVKMEMFDSEGNPSGTYEDKPDKKIPQPKLIERCQL